MSRLRALADSIPFLATAAAVSLAAMVGYVVPAAGFISERSTSVTSNFYLIGGFMLLLAVGAVLQGLLVVRLVWGKGSVVGFEAVKTLDLEDEAVEVRALKVTGTKKVLVIGAAIAANILVFDLIAGGALVVRTRQNHVITLLRSEDGQSRADAVPNAIQLAGDEGVAAALGRVLDEPGEAREWAAYAAGVRHDSSLAGSLRALLATGGARERAAAAVALARLGDPSLYGMAPDAFGAAGELGKDVLIALGMLGKLRDPGLEADLALASGFVVGLLDDGELDDETRRIALWTLGRLEAPEGLEPLEAMLGPETELVDLCIALESLGEIGAADTSPVLLELLGRVDHGARCPELVAADFTGHEVLLCGGMNLVERILREIASIGDRRAQVSLERIAEDERFSESARRIAAEIAFLMKHTPLPG